MTIKKIIKTVYSITANIIIAPFIIIKPLIIGGNYFLRSIYSQWKRLEFQKAPMDIVISYPIKIHGGKHVKCGKGVFLGANGDLSTWDSFMGVHYQPSLEIGDNVTIRSNFHISAINHIKIGNNVLTGNGITIVDNGHGAISIENMEIDPKRRVLKDYGTLTIEDNVWIGDKVTIIGGVTIGYGSVIGSNSVVTKDIPSYCVAAGIPAKIIKKLK